MENIKVWLIRLSRSKTIMFNAAVAGLAAAEGVFSILQPFVPGNAYAWLTVILTVGNAILRVLTTQPLTAK